MKSILLSIVTMMFVSHANADIMAIRSSLTGEISVDVALGKFTLGANTWSPSISSGTSSFAIKSQGVRAAYHFNGAFNDSWYFAAGMKNWSVETTGTDFVGSYTGSLDTKVTEFFFGRSMNWGFFNITLGVGAAQLSDNNVTITYTNATTSVTDIPASAAGSLEFTLGFKF